MAAGKTAARTTAKGSAGYRLAVAARVLLAAGGGYLLAALATDGLARTLSMRPSEAVLTATMASFAVYAAAVIWAFAARSVLRAGMGILVPALLLGILSAAMRQAGAS